MKLPPLKEPLNSTSSHLLASASQNTRAAKTKRSPSPASTHASRELSILLVVFVQVVLGIAFFVAGSRRLADLTWAVATLVALLPLARSVLRELSHGKTGVDLIALLAMTGSLILTQYLAGAVVGMMLSGGLALEGYASQRAKRELSSLLSRAPSTVHLYQDGQLCLVDITKVSRGDLLLVKSGEIVPVDGTLATPQALLDESALTGESLPVNHLLGDGILSGVLNLGQPFDLQAITSAQESTYAGIIRLVQASGASKAPFVRLADRYALWFLPLTLLLSLAAWAYSGDAVRALAVLVVATPCPLILAAPVAIVSGISRSASRGIIIKAGGALEALARARTLVLDKTGTLTTGTAQVSLVESFGHSSVDQLLCLAASLDQVSPHVFATSIVAAARLKNLVLEFPSQVQEEPGIGIAGYVGKQRVRLGQAHWVAQGKPLSPTAERFHQRVTASGLSSVFIAIDNTVSGALVMADPIRPDTPRALQALRKSGISRIVLLSGDKKAVTLQVGHSLGINAVFFEHTPEDKVKVVSQESARAVTVMVGDGINDAPALAVADVGVAMGIRGASASSQAADVVILVDRLDRIAEAVLIACRARAIATQSVLAGMALSGFGMILASLGLLPPVAGAIFQEVIDVAVVLNALRALRPSKNERRLQAEWAQNPNTTDATIPLSASLL